MSNRTTNIIRQGNEYFIANTEDGRIRFGALDCASVDTQDQGDIDSIMALLHEDDFDDAADDLFGDLWAKTYKA